MKFNENQCYNPLSTVEYCPRASNVQFIDSEEFVLIAAFVSLAFLRLTWVNLVNLKLSSFWTRVHFTCVIVQWQTVAIGF